MAKVPAILEIPTKSKAYDPELEYALPSPPFSLVFGWAQALLCSLCEQPFVFASSALFISSTLECSHGEISRRQSERCDPIKPTARHGDFILLITSSSVIALCHQPDLPEGEEDDNEGRR